MNRREFISLLGGAAAWPLAAWTQQPQHVRRIGVLMNTADANAEGRAGISAFQQALQQLGWAEDRDLRIEIRWGANDIDRTRQYAAELIAFSPDIFLASGTVSTAAAKHITQAIPIVFVQVSDPVGGRTRAFGRPAWGQRYRFHEL